jgi:ankyrin repeat protein
MVQQHYLLLLKNGYLEIVELLLKNGADTNKSTKYGETPLSIACKYGHLEIVELLLKNGADVNPIRTDPKHSNIDYHNKTESDCKD